MTTGEKIYNLRLKAGLSQDELAEKLEVSRQTVSNWENDKNKIDLEKAKKLCEVFSISLDELCSENEIIRSEIPVTKQNNKKSAVIFSVVALIISLSVLIVAIILAAIADDKSENVASFIAFNAAFGWIAVAGLSLIVAIVAVILLIRTRD